MYFCNGIKVDHYICILKLLRFYDKMSVCAAFSVTDSWTSYDINGTFREKLSVTEYDERYF